ncbi:MAG: F0F1 ATP synthase subunit epsilon [Cellulosilyticaceae bacterium]
MAKNQVNLQIITPTRLVLDKMVDSAVLKTTEGEMGILYDHEPVVTLLSYGELRYKEEGKVNRATVMGGFAEVTKARVTILTDASELAEEIDVDRAKQAKERAESYLGKDQYDTLRAEAALRKSLVRIKMAEKAK